MAGAANTGKLAGCIIIASSFLEILHDHAIEVQQMFRQCHGSFNHICSVKERQVSMEFRIGSGLQLLLYANPTCSRFLNDIIH